MKRVMMLVAVAGGIVQMAVGADTHDYSNYAKLNCSPTVTTHWPTADQWTPAGEMNADGHYLVPSGKTLTCSSRKDTLSDGPWPAAEIAVEGTLLSKTNGGRQNTPETSHLALLPGGVLQGNSAYSTFTAETLDIRGTAESPAVIMNSYATDSNKSGYYLLINAVLTSSDPDSVVKFVNPKTTDYSFKQRATRILGVRDFLGTIVVEGSNAWVRLETTAMEFDLAGTLELKDGGNFYVDTVSPTIGTLKIGAGSTFQVVSGCSVTVTDALELGDGISFDVTTDLPTLKTLKVGSGASLRIAAGCAITVTEALEVAEGTRILVDNPFGDWTSGTPKDAVRIATFGPEVERPADYRSIFDVALPANAVGAIPDILFTETENEDGSVDVSVSYREIVIVETGSSANKTPFTQTRTPDYSMLSDKSPISAEKDYYATSKNIYVIDCPEPCVFTGHSLTIDGVGGKLSVYDGITFVCTNLYLAGSRLTQQKAGGWARFDGNIYAQGGKVSFAGAAGVEIKSDIHGSSDLTMYRAGDTDKEDFTKTSHVYLKGDNSDFSGRFLFGELSWTGGETNHVSELHVWEKANLGGAMPEVTSNGVTIADTCSLVYNGGAETFDEVTRGWTFEGASGLNLVSNVAVKVRNTITVADTLTKRGAGTLVAADVDGSELVIAAGGLGAASPDAFKGLASLAFAAGTRFVVNASADDSLKAAGADLSATALTVPAGGVPVEFVNVPKSGCALTVATFATEAEAAKFVFKRPRGYTVKRTVEAVEGGGFALKAEIEEAGFLLLIGGSRPVQTPRTVFASDLGYDEEDSTACLQRALDSGAQRVIIDRMDGPWITRPLFITNSNVTVLLEDGVVLMAKRGAFKGVSDCLVTVKGASNVFFGSDGHAVLEMHKADYCDPGKGYAPAEWRCALSLQFSQDVIVRNLTLKSSGGDGVYLKGMKNVVLENLVSIDNHRQGMSPIGVEGMTVRNCVFNDTVGTAPQSGVDMEPNSASDAFTDVVYEDCAFNGNAGYGAKLDFHKLTGLSQPVSIVFRRCEMKNNSGNSGVYVVGGSQTVYGDAGPVTGSILFEDCTVAGNANGTVRVSNLVEGGVMLAFRDCTFDARGMSASAALRFSSPDVPRDVGSVSFENCGLWIDAGKDVMTSASFAGYGITEAFGGTLTVHSGGTESAFDFAAFRAANAPDPDRVEFVPAVVDYGRLVAPEGDAALAGTYSPRLRGDFTFVQAVSGAGTCKVKFNAESESGKASGGKVVYGKCTVRDHAGKVVGKFDVGGGETVHEFAASAGEVYRFEMTRSNSGLIRVAGTVPGFGIVADGLVPLYKEAGAVLYFRVPAAARRVMVFAATDDSATVEVLDSTGTVRDSVQMSSKLRSYGKVMEFDREATAADEIWSVRCPQMSADCLIRIGGDALPFLSTESAALPRLLPVAPGS